VLLHFPGTTIWLHYEAGRNSNNVVLQEQSVARELVPGNDDDENWPAELLNGELFTLFALV
jgi:hypothetical protein